MKKNLLSEVFNKIVRDGQVKRFERGHTYSVIKALSKIKFYFSKKFTFLDIGCGTGWVTHRISKHYNCSKAVGVDISEEMISIANLKKTKNIQFVNSTFEKWDAQTTKKFDIIFSMEAVYYADNPAVFLKKIKTILSSKGVALIGLDFYKENFSSHAWESFMGVKMKLYSISEWVTLVEKAGLQVFSIELIKKPSGSEWEKNFGTLFLFANKK